MRAFHPCSSKDTIKLSVSVSVSQDSAQVCNALGLGQSPLVDASYLTWGLSHADEALVSCDMATENGWWRWPFYPSCSVSNMWLHHSRHLLERAWKGEGCWHLSLPGRARLCDVGVRVGCWDRPETDMTGPLTRSRLHAGSNTAVQHKQDFCSLQRACSETHSWQLRSLSQCATLSTTGLSTTLITVAWTDFQNTNMENQTQL